MHLNVFAGDSHKAKSSSNGREQMQPGQDRACPVLGCWHLGWGVGNADVWLVKTAFLAKKGVIPLAAFTPCSFLYLLSLHFWACPRMRVWMGVHRAWVRGSAFPLGEHKGRWGRVWALESPWLGRGMRLDRVFPPRPGPGGRGALRAESWHAGRPSREELGC